MPSVRTRFFLTTQSYNAPPSPGYSDIGDATLAFPNGYPGTVVVEGSVTANYVSFFQGELLKDLGRQIKLVSSTGTHLATYREVQRVNGTSTEGVGPAQILDEAYGCFFVKVWSADGVGVNVVRTG